MLDTMVLSEERQQEVEELLSDHNLSRRSLGVHFMVFITLIISPFHATSSNLSQPSFFPPHRNISVLCFRPTFPRPFSPIPI
jgi:hypothetical protein